MGLNMKKNIWVLDPRLGRVSTVCIRPCVRLKRTLLLEAGLLLLQLNYELLFLNLVFKR